jgi:hypothetical protein
MGEGQFENNIVEVLLGALEGIRTEKNAGMFGSYKLRWSAAPITV